MKTHKKPSKHTRTHEREDKKMHYWVRASSSDFGGTPPQPRRHSLSLSVFDILYYFPRLLLDRLFWDILSGHTAVNIGKSKVVVFGGLVDKKFLSDIVVYDVGTIFFLSRFVLNLCFPYHSFKFFGFSFLGISNITVLFTLFFFFCFSLLYLIGDHRLCF